GQTNLRIRVPYQNTASTTLDVYNDGGADANVQWSEIVALSGTKTIGPFQTSQLRVDGDGLKEPDAAGDGLHSKTYDVPARDAAVHGQYPTGVPGIWGIAFDTDANSTWVGAVGLLSGDRKLHEFVNELPTGNTVTMTYDNAFAADGTYDSKTGTIWQVNVG